MNGIYLCGLSMLTPLGADPHTIKAALDVGMSSYQEYNLQGENDPPIKFSPVPAGALTMRIPNRLPGMSPPQIRLLHLTAFALADIAPQLPHIPLPLFLAGPEPYYPQQGIQQTFIQHLLNTTGVTIDTGHSRYIAAGRSGVVQAIAAAFKYFAATKAHYALVGGVDSFYDMRTLGILEDNKRLAGKSRFDGFVPGEAAAFLLLASPHAPEPTHKNRLLILHRPATVNEPGHLRGDAPYTAEALATAIKQAISAIQAPANPVIDTLYSSENGEMHYSKEMTVATLRNHNTLQTDHTVYRPAECFGDIGAASAAVAIGLASIETKSPHTSLISASSDGGPRSAICVSTV